MVVFNFDGLAACLPDARFRSEASLDHQALFENRVVKANNCKEFFAPELRVRHHLLKQFLNAFDRISQLLSGLFFVSLELLEDVEQSHEIFLAPFYVSNDDSLLLAGA